MLAGHNPKDILDIARAGISFWEYQKSSEIRIMKRKLEHYRKKLQDLQKFANESDKDKNALIEGNKRLVNYLLDSHVDEKSSLNY